KKVLTAVHRPGQRPGRWTAVKPLLPRQVARTATVTYLSRGGFDRQPTPVRMRHDDHVAMSRSPAVIRVRARTDRRGRRPNGATAPPAVPSVFDSDRGNERRDSRYDPPRSSAAPPVERCQVDAGRARGVWGPAANAAAHRFPAGFLSRPTAR